MGLAVTLVLGLFVLAGTSGRLNAQQCNRFDVASIKVNTTGVGGGYPELAPGGKRFIATNQLMVELMMSAYDVTPRQIAGIPTAFLQERYDVYATCETPITKEQLPRLLQLLLGERFHLAIHRESKEQTVYALVGWKSGPRLHETTQEGGKPTLRQSGYSFTFTSADMAKLAGVLAQLTGRNVVDKTGVRGQYDFTLSYAPERDGAEPTIRTTADAFPNSVIAALRQQLSLNLEVQRSQVEFIVVDRLERLIPN